MKTDALGLTTRTFSPPLRQGRATLERVMQWAASNGFGWVELRDSHASMADEELRRLAAVARDCGLALEYAWDGTNLLTESARSLFARGLARAGQVPGVRFCRVTIAGEVFKGDPARLGYTLEEASRIGSEVQRHAAAAAARGITLVFENSHEPLQGDGDRFLGMRELLRMVGAMAMTFDPGNFLSLEPPLRRPEWAELDGFYREFSERIPYVHLKSAGVNGFLPTLEIGGEDEAACIRRICADGKLVCLELPEAHDFQTAAVNLLGARDVLLRANEG